MHALVQHRFLTFVCFTLCRNDIGQCGWNASAGLRFMSVWRSRPSELHIAFR